ncbi:flagellin [Halobacterium sp. KA-4]|uniref:archaellin/type IV pilin N-terminal domain-containing protein n=1 Tax=Halobacterium sp. KA-4 TaxID=2896367 RepID=UPI001E3147FA|nr:archaellin/type IV pilin N-terminal domain-containing protein [Halobacterium sp. KA-4]MCD2200448.1 flagellin [Halobacterium sp. KA-4]
MFEFITDEEERGQVGIGTLIVFIAMVLVAAIAAGVLINTASLLQAQGEATGEDASAQVSNQINVVSAIGNVSSSGDSVEYVNLTVRQAAGADNINLTKSTIEWIGPNAAATLSHENADSTTDTTFSTESIIYGDPVLVNQSDRSRIVLDASEIGENLDPGASVELTITTQYGSQTTYVANVPESLANKNDVSL